MLTFTFTNNQASPFPSKQAATCHKVYFSPHGTASMADAQQFDPDGDAVMHSMSQPVFEFIKAPRLDDWSHDALVNWEKARVQYEETVRQRCRESGERPEVAMKPVKSSIDRKLLEVLCLYELRKAVENVSNEEFRC
ncbi:unnamed protein product [Phytophthora fragariaefolia]|uniref:Unnamed protein product n=1 Tax=Phytophthora fragariaefolia TaxID=1490495 RepID=A0A9W6U110_9STRA|nr:unnamed protein product [Phytophthora fragariaefolia]